MKTWALLVLTTGCAAPLPSFGELPAFALTNQDGLATGRDDLAGEVWVANFIFTRCPTVCPTFTAKMAELMRRAAAAGVDLRAVSFSVDPEYDTPERLRTYGLRFGADFAAWSFLTGELAAVREVALKGFKMSMGRDGPDPSSIFHGTHFVLVDTQGKIRGYYDVEAEEGLARLLRDATRLVEAAPPSPPLAREVTP